MKNYDELSPEQKNAFNADMQEKNTLLKSSIYNDKTLDKNQKDSKYYYEFAKLVNEVRKSHGLKKQIRKPLF